MRNLRKIRNARKASRLVESHRARKRMIRESFDNKYNLQKNVFDWMDDDTKEALNNTITEILDDLNPIDKIKGKAGEAIKGLKKGKTQKVSMSEIRWSIYDSNEHFGWTDDDRFQGHDVAEDLIYHSDLPKLIADRLYKEYPELKPDYMTESRRSSKASGSILEKIKEVLEGIDIPEDELESEKCDKPKRKSRVRSSDKKSGSSKVRESARRRARKTLIKECHKPKRKTLIKECHKPRRANLTETRRATRHKAITESRNASPKVTLEESKAILRLRRLAGI